MSKDRAERIRKRREDRLREGKSLDSDSLRKASKSHMKALQERSKVIRKTR